VVGRLLFGLLYQPRMTDDDDKCGAVGGMRIGRENRSTRRKPVPVPPRMTDDDDECGAVGGMRIGRGNRSTRRKPVPVPLCLPGLNLGRRGGKPATNRLSYGTAFSQA
jgi:hypothetical protein